MLSIKKCRELLGETGKKWTDKRVEQVRDYLIKMAKLNISIVKQILKNPKKQNL